MGDQPTLTSSPSRATRTGDPPGSPHLPNKREGFGGSPAQHPEAEHRQPTQVLSPLSPQGGTLGDTGHPVPVQAHPTRPATLPARGWGVPTACLGVPGEAGTPTPAQAQGTGGLQQRHTGHYLAMFFYFQF